LGKGTSNVTTFGIALKTRTGDLQNIDCTVMLVLLYSTVQYNTVCCFPIYMYIYLFIYRDIYVCIYTRIYIYILVYWDTKNCIVLFCTYLYINLNTPLNTSRSMCRNLLRRNSSYFRLLTLSNIPCIISLTLQPASLLNDAVTHSSFSFPKVQFLLPLSKV